MKRFIVLFFFLMSSLSYAGEVHTNKKVKIIHSGDHRNCFFFQLDGVSEADPVKPNNPWFAVPFSKVSANNVMSILMAAKASETPIKVSTTGAASCDGLAEVNNVQWL